MLLNEICAYLKNWFDVDDDHRRLPSWRGDFTISEGSIDLSGKILDGQHFRIQNSIFNDGIYQYPVSDLKDETFNGKIQAMKVPSDLIAIMGEIEAWLAKYGTSDSSALSPYNSESFGGYSYSKSSGASSTSGSGSNSPAWAESFGGRLERWRKL